MTTFPTFNGATTDQWQQLVGCNGAQKLRGSISNAGVLINFALDGFTIPSWESSDEPYLPSLFSIVRPFIAVRFKSLVAGVPAQLTLIPALQ